jgi:hypothetical protein
MTFHSSAKEVVCAISFPRELRCESFGAPGARG